MKTVKTFITLFSISIFALLVSCSKSDVSPANQASSSSLSNAQMKNALPSLEKTKWVFNNYKINKIATESTNKATLEFSSYNNGQVQYAGRSFVNIYMGSLSVDDSKGVIAKAQPTISTLMDGDDVAMKLETEYILNLEKATAFQILNNQLLIYLGDKNNAKTEIMTFLPPGTAPHN